MKILAIGAAVAALAGGATTAVMLSDSSTTAASSINTALGAPPVRIVSVGSDKVVVDVGPSQPGSFKTDQGKLKSIRVYWDASKDYYHPDGIKYKISKNGTVINTISNTYIIVGFTPKVSSFRFCAQAINSIGTYSPVGCTTFTKPPVS